ncbi:PREDICTED: cytochrome c oxidase assembly factor 1 homolog isoform X3 [Cercocebus atys]|nr:PREDICTED: cytochrome c oxidase assembly factor 1 homolog isoform X3 [Cercocebus atys]XP_011939950.1 PREDICTED: cytochrome c oxidase assembly factor 1 homolog isoform X3 [Cercocebus atys]XP_011939953.1 PREDICTED: cytochrome c oxidase assembly factor 1 homolog isoform X3 [Cercocebus atys]
MMWQKYPGSRQSIPLGIKVLFGGVFGTGSFALVYYLIQKFHSRSLYYKLAVEQLQSHPEAQEALGPPLNIHYLKLTDRENFVDVADAKIGDVQGLATVSHLYERDTATLVCSGESMNQRCGLEKQKMDVKASWHPVEDSCFWIQVRGPSLRPLLQRWPLSEVAP